MKLFDYVAEAINDGKNYRIDFVNKSLKIGKKWIVKDGETAYELGLPSCSIEEALDKLENLYIDYKHSSISKSTEVCRSPFKALSTDQLTTAELCFGKERKVAQMELELTLLIYVLNGTLHWDEKIMGGKWFYQGKIDEGDGLVFILLRSWIE